MSSYETDRKGAKIPSYEPISNGGVLQGFDRNAHNGFCPGEFTRNWVGQLGQNDPDAILHLAQGSTPNVKFNPLCLARYKKENLNVKFSATR